MPSDTDNTDETKLTLVELQAEYERSQWALAWALRSLGGKLWITSADINEDLTSNRKFRTYYEVKPNGDTLIEIKEYCE